MGTGEDETEGARESERGIMRESLILSHPSPHAAICILLSSPSPVCVPLLLFIILPHGHNSSEHSSVSGSTTTTVSRGGELPTRPGGKGQRFISQLSGDASLTTVWNPACAHLAPCVFTPAITSQKRPSQS